MLSPNWKRARSRASSVAAPMLAILSAYQERQEPGRYFDAMLVPSATAPQRQPNKPFPVLPMSAGVSAAARGVNVTTWPVRPVIFCTVAVSMPSALLVMLLTYFDVPAASQPQLLA